MKARILSVVLAGVIVALTVGASTASAYSGSNTPVQNPVNWTQLEKMFAGDIEPAAVGTGTATEVATGMGMAEAAGGYVPLFAYATAAITSGYIIGTKLPLIGGQAIYKRLTGESLSGTTGYVNAGNIGWIFQSSSGTSAGIPFPAKIFTMCGTLAGACTPGSAPSTICIPGSTANCPVSGGTATQILNQQMYAMYSAVAASTTSHVSVLYNTSVTSVCAGIASANAPVNNCIIPYRTQVQMQESMSAQNETPDQYSQESHQYDNSSGTVPATSSVGAALHALGADNATTGTLVQEHTLDALNNYLTNTGAQGQGSPTPNFTPFVIPMPDPTETYTQYFQRLRDKGWVGTATATTAVTDSTLTGPNGVVSVQDTTTGAGPLSISSWPANPFKISVPTDAITVIKNSPTAAEPLPSAGDCSTCSINWTPIESLPLGSKFPFGLPTWIESFFGGFTFSSSCTQSLDFEKPDHTTLNVPFCSTEWETNYRPWVFPILEALMTVAAFVFMATKLMGYGDSSDA